MRGTGAGADGEPVGSVLTDQCSLWCAFSLGKNRARRSRNQHLKWRRDHPLFCVGCVRASKAALRHLTAIWAEEAKSEGISFLSLDPGDMDTPLHALAVPDADRTALKRPDDAALEIIGSLVAALPSQARQVVERAWLPPISSSHDHPNYLSEAAMVLCAPRWQEAFEANQAPRVVLRATHEGALAYCSLADLKRFAVDLTWFSTVPNL
jgi:hypothetical protein